MVCAGPMSAYDAELAKTRHDIAALGALARARPRDPEKRVRLAYRQFHLASLTGSDANFDTVLETLRGLINDFGPKEDVCLLKANVDGHFHRLAAAKEDLRMCPLLPGRPEARTMLADLDYQEGQYDRARTEFEALIEEHRTWDNLARLAHWHCKLGSEELADRLYAEAEDELTAKEIRSFAWLELQRGAFAIERGRLDKARLHYQRATDAFPGDWRADAHVAGLLAAEGKLQEAVALMQSVVERTPRPDLMQAHGELLAFAGRRDEALPWLERALAGCLESAEKGEVHYYHHLAEIYADRDGQPAEAVKWARKDIGLRCNFSTQTALAWALYRNGELAEGLEWIRLALASGASESGILATASALFRATGDEAQAASYDHAARELNPCGGGFHMHHYHG